MAVKELISYSNYAALNVIYRMICPYEFKVKIATQQTQSYSKYANHGSLDSNTSKVQKMMNKEELKSQLVTVD